MEQLYWIAVPDVPLFYMLVCCTTCRLARFALGLGVDS